MPDWRAVVTARLLLAWWAVRRALGKGVSKSLPNMGWKPFALPARG